MIVMIIDLVQRHQWWLFQNQDCYWQSRSRRPGQTDHKCDDDQNYDDDDDVENDLYHDDHIYDDDHFNDQNYDDDDDDDGI